jgi:hypothetical protein
VTPDPKEVGSNQLRLPTRLEYHSQCFPEKEGPHAPSTARVLIAQYPNDAWARYDLRNQGGSFALLLDPRNVTRILKDGRPIFAIQTTTYWVSGDKVIAIGGTAPSEILEAFIDAYLKRYPNTLEPSSNFRISRHSDGPRSRPLAVRRRALTRSPSSPAFATAR